MSEINKYIESKTKRFDATFIGLLLSILIFLPSCANAQQTNITIGTEHKIQSPILDEERRYFVNLPDSYENDDFYIQKKYPVLILLDGDSHFHSASGNIRFMSENEQIPEMTHSLPFPTRIGNK